MRASSACCISVCSRCSARCVIAPRRRMMRTTVERCRLQEPPECGVHNQDCAMFLGHFAAAFAAKALAPRVSLGTLFLAAQFADLLWPTLLLMGVERARVVPGDTVVTPLAFDHYP